MKPILYGIFLMLGSVWGGAYAFSVLYDTWMCFPSLLTAGLVFVVSFAMTLAGLETL